MASIPAGSTRCRSSRPPTACFARARGPRDANAFPAFTNGVRAPATIATLCSLTEPLPGGECTCPPPHTHLTSRRSVLDGCAKLVGGERDGAGKGRPDRLAHGCLAAFHIRGQMAQVEALDPGVSRRFADLPGWRVQLVELRGRARRIEPGAVEAHLLRAPRAALQVS